MSEASPSIGVLTLATPGDYLKAIGLALSLRVSNPGLPIAVACSPRVMPLVKPYFDVVVEEKAGLRGFVHKVHLDEYSPFDETMFFDSDVLVFRPILPFVRNWGDGPYYACGGYMTSGVSSFGLDRRAVIERLGKQRLVVIDGAGHAFFRKPSCTAVFEFARKVTAEYADYVGAQARYADEDVLSVVLTSMDLPPAPDADYFHARYLSAKPGTMQMDATTGVCTFVASDPKLGGRVIKPYMMHFADREAPLPYTRQLLKLFRKFDVPTDGLVKMGASDFYRSEIKNPLHRMRQALAGGRS
jgi:hypothetical protein